MHIDFIKIGFYPNDICIIRNNIYIITLSFKNSLYNLGKPHTNISAGCYD